jgi:bifunctional UDP-N-acetylglucosamine pyrophosphorylase/glucosamine-1-phosphate N-acetyltransferase
MPSVAVVLAAGLGVRMKSKLPKVLHPVLGVPMVSHVVQALKDAGVDEIIAVLGYEAQQVEAVLQGKAHFVYQNEQLGTGHAVLQALPKLLEYGEGDCLVVCGDTPLLTGETLAKLRQTHQEKQAKATILTAILEDPTGYGRIVKENGRVVSIIEQKDAPPEVLCLKEINTGAYCFDLQWLKQGLNQLKPVNAQGEYYLTDVISYLVQQNQMVATWPLADPFEAMGVNQRVQLAEAELRLRRRILRQHMLNGVTIIDPQSTYIGSQVKIGQDVTLEPGVILEGNTVIEEDCVIGPWSRIKDCWIGQGTVVAQSVLNGCEIGPDCNIGPYSYMRPGCVLVQDVKVGGFVEMKKTRADKGAKIPHLSYIGDSQIGKKVNIGAGTITCNYDGKNKFPTVFGDESFVGSNTNLVAPVNIGEGAYIGAGSTITKDVPSGALAIARERQRNIENWKKDKER